MLTDPDQRFETPVVTNGFHLWIDIHAPIALVFRYLTGEQELSTWWATKCSAEPRPGGKIHFIWDGDTIRTGDALFRRFEPPNHLVLEWTHRDGQPIDCDGSDPRGLLWRPLNTSDLVMLDGSRTRLHLHDPGLRAGEAYEELRTATETGWRDAVIRLKRVVETRHSQELARGMRRTEAKKE